MVVFSSSKDSITDSIFGRKLLAFVTDIFIKMFVFNRSVLGSELIVVVSSLGESSFVFARLDSDSYLPNPIVEGDLGVGLQDCEDDLLSG